MVDHKELEARILQDIEHRISLSYPEFTDYHGKLLGEITEKAQRSPLYKDRIKTVRSLEELDELPVLFYSNIHGAISRHGLRNVLMSEYAKYWQTSGYTGEPKRFYYSQGDVARITRDLSTLGYILGIRPWMSGWNFGGRDPLLSSSLFEFAAQDLGMTDYVSTPLGNQDDFFKALKVASKRGHYQICAGTPFLYLMLNKIAHDPRIAMDAVVRAAKLQYGLPAFLGKLLAKAYLRGIDYENLKSIMENAEVGLSYAEATGPHMERLKAGFPRMRFFDGFGSTECPIQGTQLLGDYDDIAIFLPGMIPEIAKPEDVQRAKKYDWANGNDPPPRVEGVPWNRWTPGLKGELLITRPGECLPLVRYATGDLIEVVDPSRHYKIRLEEHEVELTFPTIKVLGRSVDLIDFEVQDEKGDYMGGHIYARQIQDALMPVSNVKWWEFYRVKGSPPRLVFLIIPEREISDESEMRSKITERLINLESFLTVAFSLNLVDIVVTRPAAYKCIEAEIDRRVKEGRSLGQLKPKHINYVETEGELKQLIAEKISAK